MQRSCNHEDIKIFSWGQLEALLRPNRISSGPYSAPTNPRVRLANKGNRRAALPNPRRTHYLHQGNEPSFRMTQDKDQAACDEPSALRGRPEPPSQNSTTGPAI